MSPVSTVIYTMETLRLSSNSIGNKTPSPENKMSMSVNGAQGAKFHMNKDLDPLAVLHLDNLLFIM